jgi:ABC-type glycerol-3-phosphate transport system substrate-binding protein
MTYSFKRLLPALLTVILLTSSCTPQSGASLPFDSSADTTQTVSAIELPFRITWKEYSGRGEAIQKIVDSYDGESRGVNATVLGGDEDRASIETLLTEEPDTIYVLPYRFVQYFGSKDMLMDLGKDFPDEESLFYPTVWSLGVVDQHVYGIPWLGHSMCLLYNKSLLSEAGVDPASIRSTDSFITALKQIEDKTNAHGIGLVGAESNDLSWMVNQFIYGFGSTLVDSSGNKVAVNTKESAAAISYYRDKLGSYAQPTWLQDTGAEVMTAFREERVAFEIQGIWGVTDIEKNGDPFEVGILAMSDIGMKSEVGPMMVAIPKGMSDELIPEAIRFIKYLISKPAQEQIMNGEYSPEHDAYYPFRTPIRQDMSDNRIFAENPDYVKYLEEFANPSIDVPTPAWQIIKDEIYQPGLHLVMTGEMEIQDFLNRVQNEGNAILQKSES